MTAWAAERGRPRLEVRSDHCQACDGGRSARGVTSTPALGGVHVCERCLCEMTARLALDGASGDERALIDYVLHLARCTACDLDLADAAALCAAGQALRDRWVNGAGRRSGAAR